MINRDMEEETVVQLPLPEDISWAKISRLENLKLLPKKSLIIIGMISFFGKVKIGIEELQDENLLRAFLKRLGCKEKDYYEAIHELQKKEVIELKYQQLDIIELDII